VNLPRPNLDALLWISSLSGAGYDAQHCGIRCTSCGIRCTTLRDTIHKTAGYDAQSPAANRQHIIDFYIFFTLPCFSQIFLKSFLNLKIKTSQLVRSHLASLTRSRKSPRRRVRKKFCKGNLRRGQRQTVNTEGTERPEEVSRGSGSESGTKPSGIECAESRRSVFDAKEAETGSNQVSERRGDAWREIGRFAGVAAALRGGDDQPG
jgi:hypothetical protein